MPILSSARVLEAVVHLEQGGYLTWKVVETPKVSLFSPRESTVTWRPSSRQIGHQNSAQVHLLPTNTSILFTDLSLFAKK